MVASNNEENGEAVERLYRAAYECTCTSCEETCEAVADPCSQR
ncbi:hypothetical protein [Sorangium sp. So ce176]